MSPVFPIYLKYPHERTFFKVTSAERFIQLDIIGSAYHLHTFEAKIYPDRVLIMDMIDKKDGYWQESSAKEFEDKKAYCQKNLSEL